MTKCKFIRWEEEETEYTSDGAIVTHGLVTLNKSGGVLAMTLADPGIEGLRLLITHKDSGTYGHKVTTASAGGFDGTNNTATLDAQFETLELYSMSSTRWIILSNVGGVVLTAV